MGYDFSRIFIMGISYTPGYIKLGSKYTILKKEAQLHIDGKN